MILKNLLKLTVPPFTLLQNLAKPPGQVSLVLSTLHIQMTIGSIQYLFRDASVSIRFSRIIVVGFCSSLLKTDGVFYNDMCCPVFGKELFVIF